jgi:oxygen-independent coproporphyrinogen-3 oxidase
MAGIYLHIPFCKKACHYCDFHFSTSLSYRGEMITAMLQELSLRRTYLGGGRIETIYFGGGTPSLLDGGLIDRIIGHIAQHYEIAADAEITLEANPDDLNMEKVSAIRSTPVNRFSIGIQSFFEEDLRWMNRAHTAAEAESSVKRVQDAGFENITADLIYGYPLLTDEKWRHSVFHLAAMQVPHLSAYAMTVEPRTALASFIRKGKEQVMDEKQSADQQLQLIEYTGKFGYEQYELSNFALPGWYSRHNTNYWNGVHYLGIGPSAHSFDGWSRQWNVANNSQYMASIARGEIPSEREELSTAANYNEYLMTGLRTSRGIDRRTIESRFGSDFLAALEKGIDGFIAKSWVEQTGDQYRLTHEGKLFADGIASELMVVD